VIREAAEDVNRWARPGRQEGRVHTESWGTDEHHARRLVREGGGTRRRDTGAGLAVFDHRDERTDAELLAATGNGDRTALEALYVRHAPWLLVRLSRRCADRSLVDEVVQDTFVEVWRGARRWSGRGEVGAWIWGIGVRRLLDRLRHRRPALFALGGHDEVAISAEEQVLLGVQFGDVGGALDRLSPQLRAVVQATVLDGLTTREAGRLLGIPAGTVKTRMMRARAVLREELS
jgi:RNA polymerase sigma-70 factor (ECF subfamily)